MRLGSWGKRNKIGIGISAVLLIAAGSFYFGMKKPGARGATGQKLQPPETGLYEAAFPDPPEAVPTGFGKKIGDYETLIGKKVAWATLMNDFTDGPEFPTKIVNEALSAGTTPYLRILPRSKRVQGEGPETVYALERFMKGEFDTLIRQWCRGAAATKVPLLAEFAQEANGDWYGWGGFWNGGGLHTFTSAIPDGPYTYREASRRFIKLCREEHAENVTWFFHLDSQPKPKEPWNKMAFYYPGDDYIDWMGLSVFGAQYPTDYWGTFTETMDPAYEELAAVSQTRPIAVLEMGVIEHSTDKQGKAEWIREGLTALRTGRYQRVKAVNYWHESSWLAKGDNNFRVDSSAAALESFTSEIQKPDFVSRLYFR